MNHITVVSLSTGGWELLTLAAAEALRQADCLIFRTERHAVARQMAREGKAFESLDAMYESAEDFDACSRACVERLLALADEADIVYAVPDPTTDATVALLRREAVGRAELAVLPGVSHAQRCLSLLPQPPTGALRICAATDFLQASQAPEEALLLSELHSRECASDCKLRLMNLLPDDTELVFFSGKEDGALQAITVPLTELDRQPAYDHLSAAYVPGVPMLSRQRYDMDDLCAVMRRLRGPNGCPWDKEQTHESLLTNLLEESYEYIAAVREHDVEHMYDELGDVLLQIAFHAEIGRQHGEFDIYDVTSAICHKMIERHTHIFGSVKAETADDVLNNWEALKRRQRGITTTAGAMRNVSTGLSPLLRAEKVQHKAHKVGFDFDSARQALSKIHEEADEVLDAIDRGLDVEGELGDLIFSIVNVCRLLDKNPDIALFSSTERFIARFEGMEKSIKKAGKCVEDLTLSEMDVYWEAEKQADTYFDEK